MHEVMARAAGVVTQRGIIRAERAVKDPTCGSICNSNGGIVTGSTPTPTQVDDPTGGCLCNSNGGILAGSTPTPTQSTVSCVSPRDPQSSNAGDTFVNGGDSDSDQSWPDCISDDFGVLESCEDLALLPTPPESSFTTYEITVCFNFAYCVPVLYVRQLGKSSCSEIWPPILIDASQMTNAAHTVSLEVHPLLQCPCFMLNPCRTHDVLSTLHSHNRTTIDCSALVSWLALQATLFKARVSPNLFLRIATSFQERERHETQLAESI